VIAPGFYRHPLATTIAVRVDAVFGRAESMNPAHRGKDLREVEGAILVRSAFGWRVIHVGAFHEAIATLEPMEPPR
jgi:hypothetical protein